MVSVAEYIAIRLKQLKADHLFCVPGNYSAEFLLAAQSAGIKCVGTTNELEAGYAADAYSRFKGIGVCSVTYGVGSQSLYNAIAGAYVEYCPVLLINGSPPLEKVENLRNRSILFAHAIDRLRTDRTIFEPIVVASEEIISPSDAAQKIDRVLQACITFHRPVYLEVHQGVWSATCDPPAGVVKPSAPAQVDIDDQMIATVVVVDKVLSQIKGANYPVLWGGEMIQRWGLSESFEALVAKSGLPYTTTLMGKALIPETSFPEQFVGVYDSKFAQGRIAEVVERSDCIVALGTILSDFYADIATRPDADKKLILVAGNAVRLEGALFPNVPLDRFLPLFVEKWESTEGKPASSEVLPGLPELRMARAQMSEALVRVPDAQLTWNSFFDILKPFLSSDHLILTDTGLALFPSAELTVSRRGGYLAQSAWLSIGYTCGAALGASLAESGARPVVLVGDGGFQMLPQSFSTLVRQKIGAIVFVMDNGLYGIEQFLIDEQILKKGERFYRDRVEAPSAFDVLPCWDYVKLAESFGGEGVIVSTQTQLESALKNAAQLHNVPILIAVKLDPHDLPEAIEAVVRARRPDEREGFPPSVVSDEIEQPEIALEAFD